MKTSNKIRYIGASFGGSSYVKLIRVAQSLDESKSPDKSKSPNKQPDYMQKALRVAPQYWNNLKLERFKAKIKEILKTSAEPNTPEFLTAVYEYQKANPQTGKVDAIIGPKTLSFMSTSTGNAFPTSTSSNQISENLKNLSLQDQVKELGLVSLEGVVDIKNSQYTHQKLVDLVERLKSAGAPINRVTEAFPPSSQHQSSRHYNGKAIDLTLTDERYAQSVVDFINKTPGYRAINEYVIKTEFGTGGHIHIEMS